MAQEREEFQEKIAKMQATFDMQKQAITDGIMREAITLFKTSTRSVLKQFTVEAHRMLAFCAKMKNDATKVTQELKRTVGIVERQENVIFELRHLIEDKLARVFLFSETMDENLSVTQYKTE